MKSSADRPDPEELSKRFERQIRRHQKRESSTRGFWRSLRVLGAVGWPIAVLTFAGGWVGCYLDQRFRTGHVLTLLLLFAGAAAGTYSAWVIMQETR